MNVTGQSRAGWARVEITPPLGLPMGGRGAQIALGAEVLDPLEAGVLLLEDGRGVRQLWVSLDLVGLGFRSSVELRRNLSMLTEVSPDAVILNFAHVHSGPMANAEKYAAKMDKPLGLQAYEEVLIERVSGAAVQAERSLSRVCVFVHRGRSNIGVNRRNRDETGRMDMRPNAQGCCNPDLWVMDLQSESGRAIIYSHGCHPVLVYGFAWNSLSADYVGVSRRRLASKSGATTHRQFIQGLAGNVRPRVVADFKANVFRKPTCGDVERTGEDLAKSVLEALGTSGDPVELELASASGRVIVAQDPSRMPSRDQWHEFSRSDDELRRNLGLYWGERLDSGLPPVRGVVFEVGLLRLAEGQEIAWLGGEPVAEWQAVVRAALGNEDLAVWGYCQDVPCYLPTDRLLPEGGYEVVMSRWYNKDGPAPFRAGIDQVFAKELRALRSRM